MLFEPDAGDRYADAVAALDAADQVAPGVELAAACERIGGLAMGAGEAVRLATLWERVVSWASVQLMRSQVAVLDHDGGNSQVSAALVTELGVASAVSDATMGNQLGQAFGITHSLPAVTAAVEAGDLSLRHAKALDAAVAGLDVELRQQVETLVVPLAADKRLTPFQLRKAAEHAVLRLDPDGAAQRRAEATLRDSDVRYRTIGDGLAQLTATGDDILLRQVADAVDAKARDLAELTATTVEAPVGVRRVAALARLALGDEQVDRPKVEVAVTIDYRSLLALTDTPAIVAGVGVIPAAYARTLAADGVWRRLVTDPITGHALDLGLRSYRPSAALRRLVNAIHGSCRFPGCTRPALKCDCDHETNYGQAGTDRDNLHPLCRRHHNLKTRRLWQVARHPDGSESWTSPTGVIYTSEPADYRDLFTDHDPDDPVGADPPCHIGPHDTEWLTILFADNQNFDPTDPRWTRTAEVAA